MVDYDIVSKANINVLYYSPATRKLIQCTNWTDKIHINFIIIIDKTWNHYREREREGGGGVSNQSLSNYIITEIVEAGYVSDFTNLLSLLRTFSS